ncbi:MAG: choice-of-anchor Q domain-containing protein [Planctomycetota bacterium]
MIPPSLASLTIRGDDPANPGTVVIESTPDASQPALASTATALTISGVTLRTIGESPILSVAGTPATITDARIEGDPTAFEGIAYTGPALAFENVALGNGSIVRLLQGMGTTIFNGCTIDDNARVIIYAREGSLSFSRIEGSNVALDIVSSELDHLVFEDSALALGSGGTFLTFGSADTITIRNCDFRYPIDPDVVVGSDASTAFLARDSLVAEDSVFVGFQNTVLRSRNTMEVRRCEFRSNYGDFGVVCAGSDGPNVIEDSVFVGNQSFRRGGALAVLGPSTISRCDFIGNTSGYRGAANFGDTDGGAVYIAPRTVDGLPAQVINYEVTVEDSIFRDNRAGDDAFFEGRGGAIAIGDPVDIETGGLTAVRCRFERNAGLSAQAIFAPFVASGSAAAVSDSLFVGDYTRRPRSPLLAGPTTYERCTIALGPTFDGGLRGSTYELIDSILFAPDVADDPGFAAISSIVIAQHPIPNEPGVITLDPLFIRNPSDGGDGWGDDPATPDIDESLNDDFGDLRLRAGSPAIDAGTNDFFTPGDVDLDGNPRLADDPGIPGMNVDIGAYEFQGTTCLADVNQDGLANPADFNAWVIAFNAASPLADQNRDGVVNPGDFNAWVINLNAGCPD